MTFNDAMIKAFQIAAETGGDVDKIARSLMHKVDKVVPYVADEDERRHAREKYGDAYFLYI